jgi:hypothetical protein
MTYFFPSQDRNVVGATVVETAARVRTAFFMWGFPAEGYTQVKSEVFLLRQGGCNEG